MRKPSSQGWARAVMVATVVVVVMLAAVGSSTAQQNFRTLASFDETNGNGPLAGLVQGLDGNFYGTTTYGGANSNGLCYSFNCGTIFRVTPAGAVTTLYSFCAQANCADGAQPYAGLTLGNDGNFYGTTYLGGFGWGTVFKITPSGALTTIYIFCNRRTVCGDGSWPLRGALIEGSDGYLYGTTSAGGTGTNCPPYGGCGTVFKLSTSGKLTTLHSFDGSDGAAPYGGLVQGSDGNFYGTTESGGANNEGTVFKITPAGAFTSLYSFCTEANCADGKLPYSSLVQGTDGDFYGTTLEGGATNWGTVFKIDPVGNLTRLYNFCILIGCADGASPYGALVEATDGDFYGTTAGGSQYGTAFRITPAGVLTTLHVFNSSAGLNPYAGLMQATSGSFYGTTFYGGTSSACRDGCGTIFSVSARLGPFIETLPASGKVGTAVKILGTQLTGATSVSFNGVSASFKVVSPTEITASVPSGATTGEVVVTKPNGTVQSSMPFTVVQ